MALFKCKMCGGDLEIATGLTVAECEYCGTKQTLPKANDEVVQNLFNRANNLRIKCDFDKAEQIYEKILQENDTESEAHWGIVLCKYGIEYVEDPKTFKRIPTCHRTSYDAVTTDADYIAAIEHADAIQREIYETEAKAIDAIQKDVLNIVKNEKPFDVFICYKETDENGSRTIDSVIANDIYHQLTQEGLKVFYAAITLEDKLGREYEPYIFAALNSAKVMLVIGTKPQYFSAVWVKNEWSRFLKLMKADRSKLLIPCYKDMDAYDLPEEFSHLQAQDMSKIGFINDIVRGIKKVAVVENLKVATKETASTTNTDSISPLLKRAFIFLEDQDWKSADDYCEKVLDIDPECAQAYLGKLLAALQVKKVSSLADQPEPFDKNALYAKVVRYADEDLKSQLAGYLAYIPYRNALYAKEHAHSESEFKQAAQMFGKIRSYRDSAQLEEQCLNQAEIERKESIYNMALAAIKEKPSWSTEKRTSKDFQRAISLFESISDWKDSAKQLEACRAKLEEILVIEQKERIEREYAAAERAQNAKRIAIKRNIYNWGTFIPAAICPFLLLIAALGTIYFYNAWPMYATSYEYSILDSVLPMLASIILSFNQSKVRTAQKNESFESFSVKAFVIKHIIVCVLVYFSYRWFSSAVIWEALNHTSSYLLWLFVLLPLCKILAYIACIVHPLCALGYIYGKRKQQQEDEAEGDLIA